LRIKVKFRDGEVLVDCPESGEISAQARCPFCERKQDYWGNYSLEEIADPNGKPETIRDADEKIKEYLNETLGLKSHTNGGDRRRRE